MDLNAIVKALSSSGAPRATLYLNGETVSTYFAQAVTTISAVVRSEKLAPELSASLGLLSAKLGGDKGWGTTVAFDDPLLKAMLIEYQARVSGTLVDLRKNEARAGAMVWHVGDNTHVFDIDEDVASVTGLPDIIRW